jgi:hypothetical protein
MPRHISVIASLVCSLLLARSLHGQNPPPDDHAPSGTIVGVTIGMPGYGGQAQSDLLVVGLNALYAKPAGVGIDFALGTIPRALSGQSLVFGGRLDAVLPLAVAPDFWLMPVAGGSLIGVAGSEGGTALTGVNAGIGSVYWSGHLGLRTSVTLHHFLDARGAIWLAEIGLVGGR